MSNDKRLGVNPLSWVDQNATPEKNIPVSKGEAGTPPPAACAVCDSAHTTHEPPRVTLVPVTPDSNTEQPAGLFSTPTTISKEDLMSKSKVKIKQTMDMDQAIAHIKDLADSLTNGIVRAESGDESVVLCTGEVVKFEMKLSRKKDKAKCSIEMEWDDDGSKADEFSISS